MDGDQRNRRDGWIRGIRYWTVSEFYHGYRLSSVMYESVWPVGEPLRAMCRRSSELSWQKVQPHTTPYGKRSVCPCGIYGVDGIDLLVRFFPTRKGLVWGYVSLWGRIVTTYDELGRREWRAEFAYPDALVVTDIDKLIQREFSGKQGTIPATEDLILELANTYSVPVLDGFVLTTGEVGML